MSQEVKKSIKRQWEQSSNIFTPLHRTKDFTSWKRVDPTPAYPIVGTTMPRKLS